MDRRIDIVGESNAWWKHTWFSGESQLCVDTAVHVNGEYAEIEYHRTVEFHQVTRIVRDIRITVITTEFGSESSGMRYTRHPTSMPRPMDGNGMSDIEWHAKIQGVATQYGCDCKSSHAAHYYVWDFENSRIHQNTHQPHTACHGELSDHGPTTIDWGFNNATHYNAIHQRWWAANQQQSIPDTGMHTASFSWAGEDAPDTALGTRCIGNWMLTAAWPLPKLIVNRYPLTNEHASRCNPLHTIKFIPDSDMLFPYSYQNSIP